MKKSALIFLQRALLIGCSVAAVPPLYATDILTEERSEDHERTDYYGKQARSYLAWGLGQTVVAVTSNYALTGDLNPYDTLCSGDTPVFDSALNRDTKRNLGLFLDAVNDNPDNFYTNLHSTHYNLESVPSAVTLTLGLKNLVIGGGYGALWLAKLISEGRKTVGETRFKTD